MKSIKHNLIEEKLYVVFIFINLARGGGLFELPTEQSIINNHKYLIFNYIHDYKYIYD